MNKLVKEVGSFDHHSVLKKFLSFHYDFPINLTERLIRQRNIWVIKNGFSRVKDLESKTILEEGDIVHIKHDIDASKQKAPEELLNDALIFPPILDEDRERLAEALIYRDKNLLVLNKPAGLAMHGGTKSSIHLQRFMQSLKFGNEENPRPVHRLDKQASGLILLGRTRSVAAKLSALFANASDPSQYQLESEPSVDAFGNVVNNIPFSTNNTEEPDNTNLRVKKIYWAVLTDIPKTMNGKVDKYLFVPPESNIDIAGRNLDDFDIPSRYKVKISHPDRVSPAHRHFLKRTITSYEVMHLFGRRGCLVKLMPETGRKHQLRVHCATYLKSPILGDIKYGEGNFKKLYNRGWGNTVDFSKYSGLKSIQTGIPLFLHLRSLVIENYFKEFRDSEDIKGSNFKREGDDLVLEAPLNELWKDLLEKSDVKFSV